MMGLIDFRLVKHIVLINFTTAAMLRVAEFDHPSERMASPPQKSFVYLNLTTLSTRLSPRLLL